MVDLRLIYEFNCLLNTTKFRLKLNIFYNMYYFITYFINILHLKIMIFSYFLIFINSNLFDKK